MVTVRSAKPNTGVRFSPSTPTPGSGFQFNLQQKENDHEYIGQSRPLRVLKCQRKAPSPAEVVPVVVVPRTKRWLQICRRHHFVGVLNRQTGRTITTLVRLIADLERNTKVEHAQLFIAPVTQQDRVPTF